MKNSKFLKLVICYSALLVFVSPAIGVAQIFSDAEYLKKCSDVLDKTVTPQKVFGYVKELSDSTKYAGRLCGTVGMENASNWVVKQFRKWGVKPLKGTNCFSQAFPHPCIEVSGDCSVKIDGNYYPWAKGWYSGGTSASGKVASDVVYAGYGVTAPELGYDDYAGIDVKGKIVLIDGETPNNSNNPDTLRKWYNYTLHENKVQNAVKHGAVGMLYIWVPGPNNIYDSSFVYAFVNDTIVKDIFKGSGRNHSQVVDSLRKFKVPCSFNTGKKAEIVMNTTYNAQATGANIIGVVEGSDPVLKNEYIVICAHLDHLGMVPYHIAGANDNLSSTAALLAVAESLSRLKERPKRSVMFLNTDGEESGLVGSLFYTKNPLVPADKIKLILNLEQVGVGKGLSVSYKFDRKDLVKYITEPNDKFFNMPLGIYPSYFITRPRTDGAVFMKSGYPVINLSGRGGRSYYHNPKDNIDSIDADFLAKASKFLFWSVIAAANE